jgi:hypothetical protein
MHAHNVAQKSHTVTKVGNVPSYTRERTCHEHALILTNRVGGVQLVYENNVVMGYWTLPNLSTCYVAPIAHLFRTLTSNPKLNFMQPVLFEN